MKKSLKHQKSAAELKPDLSYLAEKWPSSVVARTVINQFTGGAIEPRYMANLDSEGKGPEGSFRIKRKVVYPVSSLIKWLEERSEMK